jgi:hypothetical protein
MTRGWVVSSREMGRQQVEGRQASVINHHPFLRIGSPEIPAPRLLFIYNLVTWRSLRDTHPLGSPPTFSRAHRCLNEESPLKGTRPLLTYALGLQLSLLSVYPQLGR